MDDPIAILRVSPVRRFLALTLMGALGALILYLLFTSPPAAFIGQAFLLGLGLFALYNATRLYQATQSSIYLFADRIEDSDGTLLCRLSDIKSVDRGLFAFKPSNGLLIVTHKRLGRRWAPGLWWRMGSYIGIGGVTPASEGKAMAEAIASLTTHK